MEMVAVGDLWRYFALECGRKFKNRSKELYGELADRLLKIAAAEKEFFITLGKYIKAECRKPLLIDVTRVYEAWKNTTI